VVETLFRKGKTHMVTIEQNIIDDLSKQVLKLRNTNADRCTAIEKDIARIRDVLERMNIACEEIGDSQTAIYECLIDLDEILKSMMAVNDDSDFSE
jgi:hypothetical protein